MIQQWCSISGLQAESGLRGAPWAWKFGTRRVVAALIASRAVAINTTTAPLPPSFQTHKEHHRMDYMTPCAKSHPCMATLWPDPACGVTLVSRLHTWDPAHGLVPHSSSVHESGEVSQECCTQNKGVQTRLGPHAAVPVLPESPLSWEKPQVYRFFSRHKNGNFGRKISNFNKRELPSEWSFVHFPWLNPFPGLGRGEL